MFLSSAPDQTGRMLGSFASVDVSVTQHANHFAASHDGLEDAASLYASASEAVFIALCVGLILVGLLVRRRPLAIAGALAVLSAGLSLAVAHVISTAVDRQRPFVDHAGQITSFVHHAADPGFPSDHATAAFAIAATLVLRLGWRWWPTLLAATVLGIVRVALGVHYPSDVLAGAVLGVAAAWLVCRIAQARFVTRHARILRA